MIERGNADIPCSNGECALVFGRQNPKWVKDALETDGYDVSFGDGVQCPEKAYTPEVEWLLRLGDPREQDFDREAFEEVAPGVGGVVDALEDFEPPKPYKAPERVNRNDPCPCGSGKKYKKCCGRGA